MSAFLRAPSFPLALLALVGPAGAVAQFRALAPAVTVALLLAVAAHWRAHRRLPWPRPSLLTLLGAALLVWAIFSAAWSIEAARGVDTSLRLGALMLLGVMAARALAEDSVENLRRLGLALAVGLGAGIALAAFDHGSFNLFRRAVRGFPPFEPQIGSGLKPAVSFLVLLLPLVLAVPGLRRAWRFGLLAAGLGVALWLPAESARLAALAGLAAAALAWCAPVLATRLGAAGLALAILAAPLLVGLVAQRPPDISRLPFSAQHRVLIWDFTAERIAERPLLGWGMEASRSIPGGTELFDRSTLDRFGLDSPAARHAYAQPAAERMPLHPHNAALQIWLELGAVGALLSAAIGGAAMLVAGRARVPAAALGVAASGAVTALLSFGIWQPWWIASLIFAALLAGALGPRRG